jgi:hypothetical protein
MIPDAVPFKKSLRFDFEHGNGNNSADLEWKWTAIWYQKPPIALPQSQEIGREASPADPIASNQRWLIALSIAAGVVLGMTSAWWKRRRLRS